MPRMLRNIVYALLATCVSPPAFGKCDPNTELSAFNGNFEYVCQNRAQVIPVSYKVEKRTDREGGYLYGRNSSNESWRAWAYKFANTEEYGCVFHNSDFYAYDDREILTLKFMKPEAGDIVEYEFKTGTYKFRDAERYLEMKASFDASRAKYDYVTVDDASKTIIARSKPSTRCRYRRVQ